MSQAPKPGWKPSGTAKCCVCNERRAEGNLGTVTAHIGQHHNMPPQAMSQTLRFCKDRVKCREVAGAMISMKMPYDHPACWRAQQKRNTGR